jgi:hypothetical protein
VLLSASFVDVFVAGAPDVGDGGSNSSQRRPWTATHLNIKEDQNALKGKE